jgi:hypothetical protein
MGDVVKLAPNPLYPVEFSGKEEWELSAAPGGCDPSGTKSA